MNKFYTFFNYNWFKIVKKNIKNNKIIKIDKKEKEEISNLVFKKEICSIVFVLTNFLITYVSSKEIYKITYKNFILFRILKIAKAAKNLTGSLVAYGTFLIILLHILINLGGILALIPLTGVPLPLLSYGGSITINTLFLIFICLRVSIESNIAKEKKKKK